MAIRKAVKMALAGSAFAVLTGAVVGTVLAPNWGQPAVVGTVAGGALMLLLIYAV